MRCALRDTILICCESCGSAPVALFGVGRPVCSGDAWTVIYGGWMVYPDAGTMRVVVKVADMVLDTGLYADICTKKTRAI